MPSTKEKTEIKEIDTDETEEIEIETDVETVESEEDYFIQAAMYFLKSRKREFTYCESCGQIIRLSSLRICSECIGEDCKDFYEKSKKG